jgi:HAD superfamily hydrolase (TIGR01509 family)|nr:HAD family phosphatase [Wujia chipingensis]
MWRTLDVEYIGRYGIHPDMEFHHQVATMTLIQAANFIKEQFDIPKTSEEIFNDFQNMVIEEYRNTIPLKPYARELVKWMKRDGYKVAVATANEIHLSEMVLERTGLMADVDTIVSCTMAGASKESPAVYELACANMRITPVECVIFEDSLRAMYTAKKAGFVTVAVYDDVAKDSWEEICRITDEQVVLE